MREEYKELVEKRWIEYKKANNISIEEQFLTNEVLNNIDGYSLRFANLLEQAMDDDRIVVFEKNISFVTYKWFKYVVSFTFKKLLSRQ